MSRIRLLLSFLCVAFALAVALMKPLPSRAGNAAAPAMPAPTNAEPAGAQPTVKARRRTTQLHLPFGKRVVDFAKHFVGTRYVYGGSSPRSGFDCSGLVRYVYGHFGISLPHSSYSQFDLGRRVGRWALRPGDLVFFDGLGHVGMYVGNGRFIHAPHSGTRVRIETLAGWYGARFVGGRRLRSA
jgi:cell wall-associated NlpC family hydrolase